MDTLNITRLPKEKVEVKGANIMANKTFVVALLMNDPYTMLVHDVSRNNKNSNNSQGIDQYSIIVLQYNTQYFPENVLQYNTQYNSYNT